MSAIASIDIVRTTPDHFEGIWPFFQAIVQAGETYPYPPDITREAAQAIWLADSLQTYTAFCDGVIAGTYYLKPNQPGLASHVANAGFMVNPAFQGKGIGRRMGLHALAEAKQAGYLAMQFNLVVSTNIASIRLWQSLDFDIIATVPQAFRHRHQGLVDAYVMYRFL